MSGQTYPVDRDVVKQIANSLGETERKPLKQIENIIRLCGAEFAQELLKDTLETEKNGGMMTSDGKRRRTPGGVFFKLARERMPEDARQEVFMAWLVASRRRAAREAQYPEFEWQERDQLFNALAESGKVSEVKISLIGRPGQIERRQNLIITTMKDHMDEDMVMPSGVPHPTAVVQDYTVYISAKQWERVEKALENPKDELIIDGYCGYDETVDGMAVFTTYVTTRNLQRKQKKQAKRESRQQKDGNADKGQGKKSRKPDNKSNEKDYSKHERQPVAQGTEIPGRSASGSSSAPETQAAVPVEEARAEPEINVDVPKGMPPQTVRKFIDLHKAAETFRQKIAVIEAKPPDQQYGLEMTQRLLDNTEKQIAQLEAQYGDAT